MTTSKKALKIVLILILALLVFVIFSICSIYFYLTSIEFNYIVDKNTNTVTITGIDTDDKSFIIPETIEGYPVTAIADYAFKNNKNLVIIKFPDTISYIGKGAFYNCEDLIFVFGLEKCIELKAIENETFQYCNNLHTIKLPNSITSIGDYAFKSCHNLRALSLPDSVSYIGELAFDNCQSIKELIIPQGVTSIKKRTFFACASLTEITIPASVVNIETEVFDYDTSLENIYVDPNNTEYISIDGVLYNKSITSLMTYPAGKKNKSFTIPETVNYISTCAFACNTNLEEIFIPRSVKKIEIGALTYSSIKTINYEGSVEEWNKIIISFLWDKESAEYTIHCTDGQIAKDGTVTYK